METKAGDGEEGMGKSRKTTTIFLQFILRKMVSLIFWKTKREFEKLVFFNISQNKFYFIDLVIMAY